MTFEKIEECAKSGQPLSEKADPTDQLCWRCVEALYRRFRNGELSREQAKVEKAEIRGVWMALADAHYRRIAAYAQYQENIRNAGGAWETLVRDAQGMTDAQLVDRLLEILSRMVGEGATADAVRKSIRR